MLYPYIFFDSSFVLHIFLVPIVFVFAQVYSNLEGNKTHVVNTAWAMLALIEAGQV